MRAPAALWALPAALSLLVTHAWIHHRQPAPYMDELYHAPQAALFCASLPTLSLPAYLPELTTPPGAYLLPTILSPVFGCSLRVLRLHAALSVLVLVPLLAAVAHSLLGNRGGLLGDGRAWRIAAVLGTHPPLLFAGGLFYTDAPAAAAIAAVWALALLGQHVASAAAGLFAASVRQTGAVWHLALAVHAILLGPCRPHRLRRMLLALAPHAAAACVVLAAFAWNDFALAVGHQEHHSLKPHWAMPAFFGAYVALFGFPLLVLALPAASRVISRNPLSAGVALAAATAALVSGGRATGGHVHPFALADNRHYTFYLYRRLLVPYPAVRDAVASGAAILIGLLFAPAAEAWADSGPRAKGGDYAAVGGIFAMLGALAATFVTVVPAQLLEPRYFIPGFLVCMMLFLTKKVIRFGNRQAAVCVVFNILVHFGVVYVFAEMPFSRPTDAHVPHDLSPGRFMY